MKSMLKVRSQQVVEMSVRTFAEQLRTRLHTRFAHELVRSDLETDLDRLIYLWIKEAARFGVVNEPDVELFTQCKVTFGADFPLNDGNEWAAEILRQNHLDGEAKMDRIDEYMLFGLKEPA